MGDHHPDVLDADHHGEDHPGDEETLAPLEGPNHEEASTDNPKKGIKDCVLDERTNTDISTLTFITKELYVLSILDNIECGSDHCDGKLNHSDIKHCGLQWNTKNRGEARSLVTHSGETTPGYSPRGGERVIVKYYSSSSSYFIDPLLVWSRSSTILDCNQKASKQEKGIFCLVLQL